MRRKAPQRGRVAKRRRVNNSQALVVVPQQNRFRSNSRTGGFLGVEYKFLDTELVGAGLTTSWNTHNPTGTGCTNSLSVPQQGDGESQRDGKNYVITSIHLRGSVWIEQQEAQAAPESQHRIRVILYQDTQTNGAEATATDIMDSGHTNDTLAFRNLQYSKRFKIWMDKTMVVVPAITSEASNVFSNGRAMRNFTYNKKFKVPIKVSCNGTTANVNVCVDNNFGIAAIADTSSDVGLDYNCRVRFVG